MPLAAGKSLASNLTITIFSSLYFLEAVYQGNPGYSAFCLVHLSTMFVIHFSACGFVRRSNRTTGGRLKGEAERSSIQGTPLVIGLSREYVLDLTLEGTVDTRGLVNIP